MKHLLKGLVARARLGRGAGPSVLLTFDDGPHPEVTPRVLDLLGRHGARAVFFVVGSRIPRAPRLLSRILAEGHVLGNHSFSHPLGRHPGLFGYLDDLRRCQHAIEEQTGWRPRLFRPPQGRLTLAGMAAARLLGLRTVLWSLDTGDWQVRGPEAVGPALDTALRRVAARDIVLLHDDKRFTPDLLAALLPELCRRGFDLGAGAELIARGDVTS